MGRAGSAAASYLTMDNKKIIIFILIGFVLGIVFSAIGYSVYRKSKPLVKKVFKKIEERRIANIPKAKDILILSDFEDQKDLEKWDFSNASGEFSNEHAASGKSSLKISFQRSRGASSVRIEDYLEKNKRLSDWSRYEVLSFDIFNPSSHEQRMLLQIKDTKGYKIKRKLHLNAKVNNTIEIDIRDLWDSIKANKIGQFNLFLWNNKGERVFYLDNVKLLPSASLSKKGKSILESEFLPMLGEDIYKTGDYFAFDQSRWQQKDSVGNVSSIEAPLIINNYLPVNLKGFPFSGGVPFGRGEVQSLDNVQMVDAYEKSVPFQGKILCRWPDGSIKWALLDVKTDIMAERKKELFLRYSDRLQRREYDSELNITEYPNEIAVDTGVLRFSVSKNNFYLFNNVWLDTNNDNKFDDVEIITSKADLVLRHNARDYHSSLDKDYEVSIEEEGPLKVVLKAKGWLTSKKGERFCQFITRIYAYEGSNVVKVKHTFVYTGYPENKYHYLYEGKRLPKNETIEAVYIKIPVSVQIDEASTLTFATDGKILQSDLSGSLEFMQDKFNSYTLARNGKIGHTGKQLEGWLDVSSEEQGVLVGVKNFWQQFPKGFLVDKDEQSIFTYIWPEQAGELDLKTTKAADGPGAVARGSAFGLAKTHEVFFYFHKGDFDEAAAKDIVSGLDSDMLVMAAPEWIAETKVLGRIHSYDKRLGPGEDFLSSIFDWGAKQVENFHWYGMIDFGDTLSWYRRDAYDRSYDDWGWHPEGRWGWFNCEAVGTHSGALVQFLRTGDYKYLRFGANLARHIMDVDTCHYNTVANDRRLKRRIPDDYSQVGSMHRHNGNHWGGRNEEASHTNVYGLLLYYYITGDERARDVIDEVGQFFLDERITYYKHPDIAPQRTLANVLWGDILLYEFTGDEQYKKAADKWAQVFYKDQKGNGAWPENYNPARKRWEGKPHMMFIREYTLPALIAYHQLTGNKAIRECIIKATDFVISKERYAAYFDASSYCYHLTGDRKYLENIRDRLDYTVSRQKRSSDPLWNGMIYQKAIYARVEEYLYKVPFAFDALVRGAKRDE